MTRVGDTFIRELSEKGEVFSNFYAFTELIHSIDKQSKIPDTDTIPVGLMKMKELEIRNPIIEVDLFNPDIDYEIFNVDRITKCLSERMEWVRQNLASDSKIFFNFRDFPDAIVNEPKRVFKVIRYLSSLPPKQRPFGFVYEEPTGNYFPDQLGAWTAAIRREMDECGFQDGQLLVHIHEKWGLAQVSQLECLINGATGIW